eukprot:GHVU01007965.1.p1 GENE.GHVU01007965.1~~GHVU01007965.1.p1  ORF type:complete len:121 (+),score=10.00 GHVU01007965.1:1009-1371(+)
MEKGLKHEKRIIYERWTTMKTAATRVPPFAEGTGADSATLLPSDRYEQSAAVNVPPHAPCKESHLPLLQGQSPRLSSRKCPVLSGFVFLAPFFSFFLQHPSASFFSILQLLSSVSFAGLS